MAALPIVATQWAWRNIASQFPDNIVFWPAGQYPSTPGLGPSGWIRHYFEDHPVSDNNTWDYGPTDPIDAKVFPGDITNVDKEHVNDKIVTTKVARAKLYSLAKSRWTQSVSYIKPFMVQRAILSPMVLKYKWVGSMED